MKKKIILVFLIILFIIGIVLFFTRDNGKVNIFRKDNESYKEYKAGDVVDIDDSDWYVLYDSSNEDNYVTLISGVIVYDEKVPHVLDNIYEISDLKNFLEVDYVKSLGDIKLVDVNGSKIRLLDMDDIKKMEYDYDSNSDTYTLNNCPSYVCFLNNFSATVIDTKNDDIKKVDTVLDLDEYEYNLKYYNLVSDFESDELVSSTNDVTLFLRPIINVSKDSLGE